MSTLRKPMTLGPRGSARRHVGAWVAASTVLCGTATLGSAQAVAQQPDAGRAAVLQSLPRVSDLPPEFRFARELADRGVFLAGGGLSFRRDDGGEHHGFDALRHWASDGKDDPTQGAVYKVEDGAVVAAGYLVRQSDLVAGRSFRHLSLRGLDFPAPQYLSVDFLEAESTEANRYLWLWHFLPPAGQASPTVPAGELPPVTSLPPRFTLFACGEYPNDFCPQMGRHFTDGSASATRDPATTGDDGVIYGEAEGRLVFIEYVFRQEDLAAGASWPELPLNSVPIPPLDNLHLLHYGRPDGPPGTYTAHMYFIPEKTYLAWDEDPAGP